MKISSGCLSEKNLYKLKRQARSKIKFDAIMEIISAAYKFKLNNTEALTSYIRDYCGWKRLGIGLFKYCMFKGSIVAKFPLYDSDPETFKEIAREYDQWINPPDLDFRRYLPKTYALVDRKFLIQDKIVCSCDIEFDINAGLNQCNLIHTVEKIALRYNLSDYVGNHGHTPKGNIKFFDSVWKRTRTIDI